MQYGTYANLRNASLSNYHLGVIDAVPPLRCDAASASGDDGGVVATQRPASRRIAVQKLTVTPKTPRTMSVRADGSSLASSISRAERRTMWKSSTPTYAEHQGENE